MHYDLMLESRKALAQEFESKYKIAYENVEFVPPTDGAMWLAFHYKEVDSGYLSLDRRCMSFIGLVQVNIVFQPGSGTDKARKLAGDIADYFFDGKMLSEDCYIYEGGTVHPVQKSESGWMVPVRFTVRSDKRK